MSTKTKTPRQLPRHHVILAKRIRMQRVELFSRIARAEKDLRSMLKSFTQSITGRVSDKATVLRNLKPINQTLHVEVVNLRSGMRSWMTSLVRDAVKMGFRHPGDALKPIFRDNREAVAQIVAGQELFEARLSFGMDVPPGSKPGVKQSSAKWAAISQRIIKNVAKSNLQGLTVSERIWDMTSRAEADLKRVIANGIAQGVSPYEIAKQIEKYVNPEIGAADELGIQFGPGVYRSIYKNAMRLARTETNRAYTQAQAAFAQDKPWVEAVEVTLSPNHDQEDDCDDYAENGPYSPEEAADILPVHPHCMCFLTPVIDPKYLGQDDSSPDDEETPPPDDEQPSEDTSVGGTD